MTLVAAAVCPHPPLLIAEIASGAAHEMDEVRERCHAAVQAIVDTRPDLLAVVGVDSAPHATSFAPWGVDVRVDVPEPLPLSLLVGGWLTRGVVRSFVAVADDLDPGECAGLGAELASAADRVALLVMGDGSARHHEKAPGYLDPAAAPYDVHVADALGRADTDALLALDPAEAARLLVAGRAPWQVLAGAARGSRPAPRQSFFAAPYGVGYHVVTWTRGESGVTSAKAGR